MTIYNFGSLNIDLVFRVDQIAAPGETIASRSLTTFAGGKGANQSIALARAGASVRHFGKVGNDGRWLLDLLRAEGIDTSLIGVDQEPSGQALIQVDDAGQNAIVLFGGANRQISTADVDRALSHAPAGSWLLTQNETSSVPHAIRQAKARQMRVAFNPAPCDATVLQYPLEMVDLLCVNQSEGAVLTGAHEPEAMLKLLAARYPRCEIVLTLGELGALVTASGQRFHRAAEQVSVADTTAAGDTFLGYYLAGRASGDSIPACLDLATRAAALCVTRAGAMASIPNRRELPGNPAD